MASSFIIRAAVRADMDSISALLPGLASFDLPPHRKPEHLWHGDQALLASWFEGEKPQSHVHVAGADDDNILGVTIVSLQPELLSGEPSAHLEVIVVAERARGTGVGKALMDHAETLARELGALSISLHVFANNARALDFYSRNGYEGELIRCIKTLGEY